MLLVVAYSQPARRSIRNICRIHPDSIIRSAGRVTFFHETEFSAFQALRLKEKHDHGAIQVEQTEQFNPFTVREAVRNAAIAYEQRDTPSLPYSKFAAKTQYPSTEEMKANRL